MCAGDAGGDEDSQVSAKLAHQGEQDVLLLLHSIVE